jgi:hypothetical protein
MRFLWWASDDGEAADVMQWRKSGANPMWIRRRASWERVAFGSRALCRERSAVA